MIVNPLTLGQVLTTHSRLQPEKIAAQDLDKALSYRQLNARANQLANALLGLGLEPGQRVALLAYNRIEWVEIYAALSKAGLIAVPINFRLTTREAEFILTHCAASALIVEHALIDIIEPIRDNLGICTQRLIAISDNTPFSGYLDYESFLNKGRNTTCPAVVHTDDAWCIMYTSGTTGQPKGAIRSHRGMTMLALMTAIELQLQRDDNALLVMPMCHANSLNFFTAFIHCGASVTIFSRPSFDPDLCLRTFAQTGASFTSLVPTHYTLMLEAQRHQQVHADYTRVEKLMISSAPARPDTKRAIMEMFPNSGLFELYGSTEAGWVTMLHPHEQFDKLGTVGREVVGSQPIKLLDDNGDEVPDGTPGELYSCGPYCFVGYWQQPEATAAAFREKYLSVGDIAQRNDDGFIRLIDRKKNVIISGGENVYPSEVEALLGAHPLISDVAVIGQHDPLWGERVTAAVVLQADANASSQEILQWGKEHIAGYKRPREIVFLKPEEMPRNATGKILHRELRSRLATDHYDTHALSMNRTDSTID